ncbi:MAG: type II secretion system F family protein [Firmicutes bacterium]|nr:type II secretion system F family protein [Bacillota bacterium]
MVFLMIICTLLAVRRFREGRGGKLEKLLIREEETESIAVTKQKLPLFERFEKLLFKSGISMPGTQVIGVIVVVVGAFFTMALFLTGSLVSGIVGALVGVFVLRAIFQHQSNKRLMQFEAQIDTVINLLAGSLRAGASLAQAVTNIAEDVEEPAASEFRTIAKSIKLGVPAAQALEQAAERIGSQDLQMIATAALVQRETGGNLAEILDNNAETVRDRRSLRASLKALTSQGRISGMVIGIIPFGVTAIIYLVSPSYFAPMLDSVGGKIVLLGSFAAIFFGWFLIRKITSELDF